MILNVGINIPDTKLTGMEKDECLKTETSCRINNTVATGPGGSLEFLAGKPVGGGKQCPVAAVGAQSLQM